MRISQKEGQLIFDGEGATFTAGQYDYFMSIVDVPNITIQNCAFVRHRTLRMRLVGMLYALKWRALRWAAK